MFVCKSCGLSKASEDYRVHKRGYRIGKCRACEREYQRTAYARDPGKIRERKRVSMAKAREADPEKARAYRNAYHAANRDAQTEKMRLYYAKRFFWGRAMKLRSKARATPAELALIWKRQRGRCALTGTRLDRSAELDHITPRARGGDDSAPNLRWVTAEVNRAKRDMTDAEFFTLCESVMRWIGERIELVDAA